MRRERGESLTRQLLAFSRRQMLQPSVIDLAERLPEIKDMLSRSLRGDIEIRVDVPRRSCSVKVDPNEFELALLNLAVNARDAMPSGGTLTISAKPIVMRGNVSRGGIERRIRRHPRRRYRHGFRPTFSRGCSSRFSPPKKSAREPARLEPGLRLCEAVRRHRYRSPRRRGRGTAITLFLPRS